MSGFELSFEWDSTVFVFNTNTVQALCSLMIMVVMELRRHNIWDNFLLQAEIQTNSLLVMATIMLIRSLCSLWQSTSSRCKNAAADVSLTDMDWRRWSDELVRSLTRLTLSFSYKWRLNNNQQHTVNSFVSVSYCHCNSTSSNNATLRLSWLYIQSRQNAFQLPITIPMFN